VNLHTTYDHQDDARYHDAAPSRSAVLARTDRFGLFTGKDVAGAALATLMALGPLTTYALFGA
jgi:hypothetical protein